MASDNPAPALDAVTGKVYAFRGQQIRNTNAAMLAIYRLGYRLEEIEAKAMEMMPIIVYAMCVPADEVYNQLAAGELEKAAWLYYSEVTPEESGEAMAIFADCMRRFHASMTHYTSEHSEKNRQAAAATR